MSAFEQLISQIDNFIKKYYKSEMLKGGLIVLAVLFGSWLTVSVLEYFGRFGSTIRFSLLMLFVGINGYLLTRYFLIPLFRLYQIGARINRFQAASIIGRFFPNVSDRLLNTLQLNDQINENDRSFELIRASVSQRSNDLLTVRFEDAIRYSESKRYLKYVIPPVLIFLIVLAFFPAWITKGSSNVVNFNKAQEAPFEFRYLNKTSRVREGSDYQIEVDVTGLYVPEHVFVVSSRGRFKMDHTRKNRLVLTISDLRSDLSYHLESEGFVFTNKEVKVLGNSSLGSVVADVEYPAYLKKRREKFVNVADISLPEGARVKWHGKAKHVQWIKVLSGTFVKQFSTETFDFSKQYLNDENVQFILKNSDLGYIDSNGVVIRVIKDAYPSILVSEQIDSVKPSVRYFEGLLSDDYGLTKLQFNYTIRRADGSELNRSMLVQKCSAVSDKFSFAVDFSRDKISLEDKITYRFQVYDNDGVNGSKSSFSQSFVYELPTLSDLNKQRNETQNEIKASLGDLIKKADQFQKDVNKLQQSLNSKSKSDFKRDCRCKCKN